jgi:hypothetical protein
MTEEVSRELNIRWKCANGMMIAADGNLPDSSKVAECVTVKVHDMVMSVAILLRRFKSEQVFLSRPWDTYARKCERNLDNGSCKITIPAVDGSEEVMFVALFLEKSGTDSPAACKTYTPS